MMPSNLDTGNPEIDEDFSRRVLIIRLTASSNLLLALAEEFASSELGSSCIALLVAARDGATENDDDDAVLDAEEADKGFFGYRCVASFSRSRMCSSRLSSSEVRDNPALVLADAELGF
jgi:hypothetical protein